MHNPQLGFSQRRVMQEQNIQGQRSRLSWSPLKSDIILSGQTQINSLKNIRNTVLSIRRQFQTNTDPKIHLNPLNRDDFNKRMVLLQNQVQGLMRRKINFTTIGDQGQRSLDYTGILNQKQNQIVELQKKVQNIQFQLRKASARQIELENHIVYLNDQLRVKEQIINGKNQVILAEVANSNAIRDALNKIRRNVDMSRSRIQDLDKMVFNEVTIPDIGSFQIKAQSLIKNGAISRSRTYQQLSPALQVKTRVVEMFREVQKIIGQTGQINELQFQRVLQGYILGQKQSRIYEKSMIAAKRGNIEEKYHRLRQNFAIAAGIYQENVQKLKRDNPTIRINFQKNLFEILQRQNVKAYQIQNGAVYIDAYTQKTVEVPVQDARTKHLIHILASEMKKFTTKYPQLLKQMDAKLCQFFQQQIIDCIQVDQIDRLVNIVKYVPQVVKVENVYAYSSEKTRKVEFHLRVLIKALLEELHKIKVKTGVILQMDEGVIGMITAQIMGIVNVDDILKVFRTVPKIVEVEKIVQKIVQKRVQVPMLIPITKQVQKIVQVERIVEVDRFINVPIQIPVIQTQIVEKIVPIEQIIERVIQVPTIVQRIVQIIKEVPRIVQVIKYVEKIVEVQKIVEVERVVNHILQQPEQIEIIKQKIIPVETIIEKIVQVPVIKEKIVQRIVEVIRVEVIQKIVEKTVPIVEYRKALQVNNHIETIHKPVDRIVQKVIPVERIVQRIVEVPTIIEKIVEVIVERVEIKEVEVIRQKLVREEIIKPVQVIVKEIVEVVKEVPFEIQKIVEVPVIHQVVKRVQQIVQKPVIQRVQTTVVKQVYIREPMIVYQPKIVEVQRVVNHIVQVPKIVRYIEEKIIQIPRNVQRIKQVRVQVDRIVQKLVEVPKIVQVERIVQKIVVVPRIIERIIQIPQIIQKIVQKQVEKIVVRDVERIVQIPVIQQKIVEVEVIKNVYIEIEKPVDRVVDKLVTINNFSQRVVTHEVKVDNVIEVIREVPKTISVDKIVPAYYEQIKPVVIQKVQIVPREIAVPVEVVVQKFIPVRQIVQKIIQVPQFIEKIVETKQEKLKIEYIQKIVQKIVVDQRIRQVQKIVPYIQEVIKEIPTIIQKIVTIESKVQQIITAQQIVEKIVERSTIIPRIYEVEKVVPKLIKVPQIIEVERIIPQIVRVNQYIQKIVEKIVQVPRIIERIKEIQIEKQKIVTVNSIRSEIVQIQRVVEKIAILEQMKEVIKNVNHIERVIKIVEQIERSPVQVTIKEQIIVQIPYILQKIVERIIVMPQIVEVLKYVHQITESNELLTVQNQQEFKGQQLKLIQLTKNMKPALDNLIRELRGLQNVSQVSGRVEVIQGFLVELQKLIAFPKLIRIKQRQRPQQQIVQKQKIVRVPVQDERHLRKQISMSILIEKLIMEIKRITSKVNIPLELDDQIKMIFFAQLQFANKYSLQGDLKDKFNMFSAEINRKFETMGPWAEQSQLMLNTILEERFKLAEIIESANVEIERARNEYENVVILLNRQMQQKENCHEMLNRLKQIFESYPTEKQQQISQIKNFIFDIQGRNTKSSILRSQITHYLSRDTGEQSVIYQNYESKIRQKQATINKLKDSIYQMQRKQSQLSGTRMPRNQDYVRNLERQVQQLRKGKQMFDSRTDLYKLEQSYKSDISTVQRKNNDLEQQNSQLKNQLDNTSRQLRVLHQNQKFLMRRDDKHRVDESSYMRASGQYSSGSLSHSEIKRAEGSLLSQSQYSAYQLGGRRQDFRQSPSTLIKGLDDKDETSQVGLMTPLQGNKFRSPESTGMKYTQSFLREQSQSLTGQSPQTHTLFTTPGSIKQEPERQKSEQQKKQSLQKIARQYRYFFSPGQREKK